MKKCKICGAMNENAVTKCGICNSEFPTEELQNELEFTPTKNAFSLKVIFSFVISFLWLAVYTAYTQITGDYRFAYIVYPFLITAFVMISGFWFYLFIKDKKSAKMYCLLVQAKQDQKESESKTNAAHLQKSFSGALRLCVENAKHEYNAPVFKDSICCADAVHNMTAAERAPETKSARCILASLASCRMAVLCTENEQMIQTVRDALAASFGTESSFVQVGNADEENCNYFTAKNLEEITIPSAFLTEMASAEAKKPSVAGVVASVVSINGMESAFESMNAYLANAYVAGEVTVSDADGHFDNHHSDVRVPLAENLRILLCMTPDCAYHLPPELLKNCAFVDVKSELGNVSADHLGFMSFTKLEKLTGDAASEHYLSESVWKKIDELENYVNKFVSFSIDNKVANAMESFIGICMASGSDETEALDAVLACKMLPYVLSLFATLDGEEKPSLSTYLDEKFGLENLPLCTEILKKFSDV